MNRGTRLKIPAPGFFAFNGIMGDLRVRGSRRNNLAYHSGYRICSSLVPCQRAWGLQQNVNLILREPLVVALNDVIRNGKKRVTSRRGGESVQILLRAPGIFLCLLE